MKLEKIREALFQGREFAIPLTTRAEAYNEANEVEDAVRELAQALESTTWSSGCWCSGKDGRGHSATCEGRRAAMRRLGFPPPGSDAPSHASKRSRRKA